MNQVLLFWKQSLLPLDHSSGRVDNGDKVLVITNPNAKGPSGAAALKGNAMN